MENGMDNKSGKIIWMIGIVVACVILLLTGCGYSANPYEGFVIPIQGESTLSPVDSYYSEEIDIYENEGVVDQCIDTYKSEDGLCIINKMEHYYDVTLDYEKGTPSQVGKAYASTILEAFPEFERIMEPYIYENILMAFPDIDGNYDVVNGRLNALFASIPNEYREELESFAQVISEGESGFAKNGQISYEEALLMQMVPDALRGTSCSAVSVWGSKTVTGGRITYRSLEWLLGSDNQMCMAHAVVHMKKGEKTITSFNVLGLLNIVSAINDDGVFVGILDAQSGKTYTYEGKVCYTYELRYALETFDNAYDFGNYMVDKSPDFTWCHNLIISDKEHSYCAEDAVKELQETKEAYSILRDDKTPLMEGIQWDSSDSLCVVNSFASAGNKDGFSGSESNIVRFAKYNQWISSKDKFTVADIKNVVTQEVVDQDAVSNVHVKHAYQLIIVDYDTGTLQVAFTQTEGVVDRPVFVNIGRWTKNE